MKITPALTLAFLVSLSLSAQDTPSPQALSAQVGAGLSFWNFTNERAVGSDTFDLRLKPALAPEISLQLLVNSRLGLVATAGAWLTRLKDSHFNNEFSETRHNISHGQGRNFYFAAGPVARLLSLESGPSITIFCKGGYFFSWLPEISEEFILLEDFRRRRLEYQFSRGRGWIWQPGLALNTPAERGIILMGSGEEQFMEIEDFHFERSYHTIDDDPILLEITTFDTARGRVEGLFEGKLYQVGTGEPVDISRGRFSLSF